MLIVEITKLFTTQVTKAYKNYESRTLFKTIIFFNLCPYEMRVVGGTS